MILRLMNKVMSCKAAVKGNDKLSYSEAQALIQELLKLEDPLLAHMADLQL